MPPASDVRDHFLTELEAAKNHFESKHVDQVNQLRASVGDPWQIPAVKLTTARRLMVNLWTAYRQRMGLGAGNPQDLEWFSTP